MLRSVFSATLAVFVAVVLMGSSAHAETVADGATLFQQLQAKEISCDALTDEDFEKIGDYFMMLMKGSQSGAMEHEESEADASAMKLMHVHMGKMHSGCDTQGGFWVAGTGVPPGGLVPPAMPGMMGFGQSAQFPPAMGGMVPLGPMHAMSAGFGSGAWGWPASLVMWGLVIAGIVSVVRWAIHRRGGPHHGTLEILKERYARGEIDKREFEEIRKDLHPT